MTLPKIESSLIQPKWEVTMAEMHAVQGIPTPVEIQQYQKQRAMEYRHKLHEYSRYFLKRFGTAQIPWEIQEALMAEYLCGIPFSIADARREPAAKSPTRRRCGPRQTCVLY